MTIGTEKLERCGYPMVKNERYVNSFRQNVRTSQTDRYSMTAQAALMHSIARQKDRARRFLLLKLTTERQKTSRDLFAAAELLVKMAAVHHLEFYKC